MDLSPSTWRLLGLSVAVSYTCLGTFAIAAPVHAGKLFGLLADNSSSFSSSSSSSPSTDKSSARTEQHGDAVTTSMKLLGARDLSIGLALTALHYQGNHRAVGTVILASMVLCVVDVYEIWRRRGAGWGGAFAAGAAVWLGIGLGLL